MYTPHVLLVKTQTQNVCFKKQGDNSIGGDAHFIIDINQSFF